jgi:hypothetical protein
LLANAKSDGENSLLSKIMSPPSPKMPTATIDLLIKTQLTPVDSQDLSQNDSYAALASHHSDTNDLSEMVHRPNSEEEEENFDALVLSKNSPKSEESKTDNLPRNRLFRSNLHTCSPLKFHFPSESELKAERKSGEKL